MSALDVALGSHQASRVPLDNADRIALHLLEHLEESLLERVETVSVQVRITGSFRTNPTDHVAFDLRCEPLHHLPRVGCVCLPVGAECGPLDEDHCGRLEHLEEWDPAHKVVLDQAERDALLELGAAADVRVQETLVVHDDQHPRVGCHVTQHVESVLLDGLGDSPRCQELPAEEIFRKCH